MLPTSTSFGPETLARSFHWTVSRVHVISTSVPPGKAPLSQRTASGPAGIAPRPGTWRPVPLRPAGRGRSCRRPTETR